MNRTEMKSHAQGNLMTGIANVLGYFTEGHEPDDWYQWTEEQREEYRAILQREANRVAKLFGYEKAWVN